MPWTGRAEAKERRFWKAHDSADYLDWSKAQRVAIDFDMAIERQPDPQGDRVRVSMSSKFLRYKRY